MCQKYTVVIVFLVGFFSSSFVRVHVSPGFSSVEQENNWKIMTKEALKERVI